MRKKSHLLLAGQLIHYCNHSDDFRVKAAFYFGNILPDLKPSFFTKRHEIDGTIHHMEFMLSKLLERSLSDGCPFVLYYLRLGEVIHYLADYFTYPHNKMFAGTMREHCVYEGKLKYQLENNIAYLTEKEMDMLEKQAGNRQAYAPISKKFKDIMDFIQLMHKTYVALDNHTVELDCRYIVHVCSTVFYWILDD